MRKYFIKLNTIFNKLLVVYSLLSITIVSLIVAISLNSLTKNFEKEVSTSNSEFLYNLTGYFDESVIYKTEKLAYDLVTKYDINGDLGSLFDESINKNHDKVVKCISILQSIVRTDDIIYSISIFYKSNNIIVTNNGISFLDDNEKMTHEAQWLKMLNDVDFQKVWMDTRKLIYTSKSINSGNTADEVITFVSNYPLASHSGDNSKGFIAINIDEGILLQKLTSVYPSKKGDIVIINKNGSLVTQNDKFEIYKESSNSEALSQINKNKSGHFVDDYNGVKSIFTFATSGLNGWKYITVTPMNLYYENINMVVRVIIYTALIFIFISILLSTFLTTKIYEPIRKLTTNVKKLIFSKEDEYNEVKIIDCAIKNMSSKISDLSKVVYDYKDIILYNTLNSLVYGKYESNNIVMKNLETAGIAFTHSLFSIMKIEFQKKIYEMLPLENREYIKYSIISMIQAVDENKKIYSFGTFDGNIAAIFNYDSTDELNDFLNEMMEIQNCIKQNYHISIYIGLSDMAEPAIFKEISNLFSDAEEAIQYNFIFPDKDFFKIRDYSGIKLNICDISREIKADMSKYLKLCDYPNLNDIVKACVYKISQGNYHVGYVKKDLKNLVSYFVNTLQEMNRPIDEFLKYDPFDRFDELSNINDFYNWFDSLSREVIMKLDEKKKIHNSEYIDKVKKYIYEHIEEEIFLESVAKAMYISPSYLSKIFKNETNMRFIDYLTKCRMEKAQELLLDSDNNVEKIANKLGYSNVSHFIKRFKETYGKTPYQFRTESIIAMKL